MQAIKILTAADGLCGDDCPDDPQKTTPGAAAAGIPTPTVTSTPSPIALTNARVWTTGPIRMATASPTASTSSPFLRPPVGVGHSDAPAALRREDHGPFAQPHPPPVGEKTIGTGKREMLSSRYPRVPSRYAGTPTRATILQLLRGAPTFPPELSRTRFQGFQRGGHRAGSPSRKDRGVGGEGNDEADMPRPARRRSASEGAARPLGCEW